MRTATASNSQQRKTLLRFLDVALQDAADDDGYIAAAIEYVGKLVAEPNLIDFSVFLVGSLYGETESSYVRGLELRCMPYRDYLRTPEWAARREEQLVADGGRCRACNSDRGLQVHHRTYRNRGREEPGDLITLCGDCHHTFHTNRQLARA